MSYAALKVSRGKTLNERVISWHLLEDVLGWFTILVAAIILQFKDIHYLDLVLSLLITMYILWNALKNLREVLFIFLQGKPHEISYDAIEKEMLEIKNIASIHHMHIWSLDGEKHVFTTHVKLRKVDTVEQILKVKNSIKKIMDRYPFEHCTIETEIDNEVCKFEKSFQLPRKNAHKRIYINMLRCIVSIVCTFIESIFSRDSHSRIQ